MVRPHLRADVVSPRKRHARGDSATNLLVIAGCCLAGLVVCALLAIPWGGLVTANCHWDCWWYLDISRDGYPSLPHPAGTAGPGQAAWAFFPLYPALIHLTNRLFGLPPQSAGLLVNILLWPLLIFLCQRDAEWRGQPVNRALFALFFVLFPFTIWYTAQYSEALYGVVLMATLLALRRHHILSAAMGCALLALARPTGFAMSVCLAGWWLVAHRDERRGTVMAESLLLIAAGGAGLSLFVLYLAHLTGDGFAFLHVQTAWARHLQFFVLPILQAFKKMSNLPGGLCAVATIGLLVWMWRLRWRLAAWLVGMTALIATSTSVLSLERYVFGNPLTIEFLACFTLTRSPPIRALILTIMGLFHILTTLGWYSHNPSLM